MAVRKEITLVVTDSGLGGLNVAAKVRAALDRYSYAEKTNVIYFNALPEKGRGYNSMKSLSEKAEAFDSVLNGIVRHCSPDIILIACNTLSVVYEHTAFFKNPATEVMGIVELGVSMILKSLQSGSKAVILGTPTTIDGEAHKKLLMKNSVNAEDIIAQPCRDLESEIQNNARSERVREMIRHYLTEAVPEPDSRRHYVFALCCTHYEYSLPVFEECIKERTKNYTIVNPNAMMVEELNRKFADSTIKEQMITEKVLSRTPIAEDDMENVARLLEPVSKDYSLALLNYVYDAGLFEVSALK